MVMKNITLILVALFTFNFVGGQIVAWDMNGNSGNEATVNSTTLAPNLNPSIISRGAGLSPDVLSNAYSSDTFVAAGTQSDAITNNEYLEFQVSSTTGYQVSLTTLDAVFRRSSTGPQSFIWRYSTDGTNFFDIGGIFTYTTVAGNGTAQTQIDLTTISALQNVASGTTITFRLYGWGATGGTGTFAIGRLGGNDLSLGGSVSLIPCPGGTVTWSAGAWSNGTGPDLTTEAIISDDYDTGNGGNETSFSACSLTVDSGVILTVNNGTYIEVENDVTVDGEIYVASSGNFVQNDDAGTFNLGVSGVARVNKVTPFKSKWYYYTYWSSPVTNETIENAFPNVDGDRRFWFNADNFKDTNGDDVDEEGDDWQYAYRNDTMIPGVGYASTEARNFDVTPFGGGSGANGTATFEGEFNTRDVPVSITFDPTNPGMKWNFIGNPYPSAIDFDLFFAENSGIVEGAAYFWSQASPPSSSNAGNQQLNFSTNDYAMYASGSGLGTAGASGSIPNNFVPSAQGFFIEGNTIGTAKFTNAMRVASTTSNNLFFKGSTKSQKASTRDPLENRIWINLTSDNGVFNQIAVAYVENATHNDDGSAFDAVRIVTKETPAALYSIIENCDKKFAIQGKNINSINEDETITLGFKTKIKVATLYTLSIAKMEGDFLNSHSVFVKDNLLNKVHDLTVCDYTFTSETGEFNNRFEIVFKADALSTANALVSPSQLKIAQLDNDNIQFTAPNGLRIKTVSIFDLFGRQLYQFNGQNDTEVFKLSNLNRSVFVAEVALSNGRVISKKALKK